MLYFGMILPEGDLTMFKPDVLLSQIMWFRGKVAAFALGSPNKKLYRTIYLPK